jgi:hypothetical protein
MRSPIRTVLLAAGLLALLPAGAAAEAPKLDAARATKLAADYLATLGSSAPYIVSVTLEKGALVNGTQSWVVRWSEPINDGANREIGVRVKMDGTVAHLVEDVEGRKKRAATRPMLR